ncbi:MAG: hypothetical protein ABR564_05810 [Candidatus Dormibacteria bacterium]
MAQVDTEGRPMAQTFEIEHVHADTDFRFTLTAEKEASVEYGRFRKTSRNGAPATGTEAVSGAGDHYIELTTEGGHVEFQVDAGETSMVNFTTDEANPTAYRWKFTANPNWSGGHINEEATEVAKIIESGQPAPSRAPRGDIPEKAEPALSSEFTRPWAPDKESEPYAPRKGNQPVEDSKADEGKDAPVAHTEYDADKPGGGDPA